MSIIAPNLNYNAYDHLEHYMHPISITMHCLQCTQCNAYKAYNHFEQEIHPISLALLAMLRLHPISFSMLTKILSITHHLICNA